MYEAFESPDVAKTGIVPLPTRGEKVLGGHEVLLVGYLKDQPNYGLVRNSWGDWLGHRGLLPDALGLPPGHPSGQRLPHDPPTGRPVK